MATSRTSDNLRLLRGGLVIPALPLALDRNRKWSPQREQALVRYYCDAGAGGLAVGVHSTQFEIRDEKHGLYEPVLSLAAREIESYAGRPMVRIAGLCGRTAQAVSEAGLAASLGYDGGLLSLTAWKGVQEELVLQHCREVARVMPIVGFYLQECVGGPVLSYRFWREFAEIPQVIAIKIAPFNRYRTIDVVRAVSEAEREDIALYTGNDDNIIADLLTPWSFGGQKRFIVGGLLGQWGVWTQRAVKLLEEIKEARGHGDLPISWLEKNAALTDMNAAIFDAANGFAGVLPGIHEVLRRQGLLETTYCLDPHEALSPGQADEISRVAAAYPWLVDDDFVRENLDRWLS